MWLRKTTYPTRRKNPKSKSEKLSAKHPKKHHMFSSRRTIREQPDQFKKTKILMKIKEKKNMLFKGDLTHYISILKRKEVRKCAIH